MSYENVSMLWACNMESVGYGGLSPGVCRFLFMRLLLVQCLLLNKSD